MGFFDDLFGEEKKKQEKKKDDPSFDFSWLSDAPKDPITPRRKQKTAHNDLEAYSDDEEADEDGFFDENPL